MKNEQMIYSQVDIDKIGGHHDWFFIEESCGYVVISYPTTLSSFQEKYIDIGLLVDGIRYTNFLKC
jgi:hypothetical protein